MLLQKDCNWTTLISFFCHRPDPLTPIEETVRAMNYLIDHGKTFYWGTSEWSAQQITEAIEIANRLDLIPPLMDQPQYNLLCRNRVEKEYLPLYKNYGFGTTIWSPLASGILTGKYSGGKIPAGSRMAVEKMSWLKDSFFDDKGLNGLEVKDSKNILQKVDELQPIATELNATLSQLAIAWCIKNPNVSTVITGASKKEQFFENMKAFDIVPKLTPDVMDRIDKLFGNKPSAEKNFRE